MPTSPTIRLLHFADVHFGVENYGRFDPETGLNSRLVDFREALKKAIRIALDADIEIALFAGDAYKTRDPNQTHQREFANCLSLLTSRGIPVVMLAGNHDIPNTRGRANAIEIFGALSADRMHIIDFPDVRVLETAKGNKIQVAGMPYLIKSLMLSREEYKDKGVQDTTALVVEKYETGIKHLAKKCDPALPTVLMGHFSVANARLSGNQVGYLSNEPEVSLSVLKDPLADSLPFRVGVGVPAFDYVALGHIHRFQDLNRGEQPPIVYSGSIERIDFGEKSEEKGVCIVDVERGHASVKHVTVPIRPFVEIDTDVTEAGESPTEQVLAAIAKQSVKDAVVKLNYRIKSEQLPHMRDADVRGALSSSFMIVALHKDVVRDTDAVRSKLLTESLDPLQALATYCETRETLKGRKDELLAFAEPLLRELEAEEAV
jgi:DNA repair protein SbcD/Mre11